MEESNKTGTVGGQNEVEGDGESTAYYVEFNVRQQRNFENCIIENAIVVTPERLVCQSDIRIKDMRKFVYYQVLEKFTQLDISNIELAYRVKEQKSVENGQTTVKERTYISLANQSDLTIDEMIKRNYWERAKCDLKYKEHLSIPCGVAKFNETLYVRFISS